MNDNSFENTQNEDYSEIVDTQGWMHLSKQITNLMNSFSKISFYCYISFSFDDTKDFFTSFL